LIQSAAAEILGEGKRRRRKKNNNMKIKWSALFHRATITRMLLNAQRDGRRAEYRWRPLFNAAKFG